MGASIGGQIAGASSGPPGGGPPTAGYQPQFLGQQDQGFVNANTALYGMNPWPQVAGQAQQAYQQQANNPYANLYQTTAGVGGLYSGVVGQQGLSNSNQEALTAAAMMPQAQSIYQRGADNPYAGSAQAGAVNAGMAGTNLGAADMANAASLMPRAQNTGAGLINSQQALFGQLPGQAQATGQGQMAQQQALYGGIPGLAQSTSAPLSPYAQQSAQTLQGAGQQVLNSGFDPQQALYARTLGQVTDQTRSGLEARGIDMSGAGAGIENKALSDFNIDWQNQQLGRQSQALGAYGQAAGQGLQGLNTAANTTFGNQLAGANSAFSAYSGASQNAFNDQLAAANASWGSSLQAQQGAFSDYLQGAQGAASLGAQGVNQLYQGSQLPYQTAQGQTQDLAGLYGQLGQGAASYGNLGQQALNLGQGGVASLAAMGQMPYAASNQIAQNQFGAIGNYQGAYGTAQGQYQTPISNTLQYMGLGPAASNANTNAFNAANQYQQQQFQGLGNLGNAVGGIGRQVGSLFAPTGGQGGYGIGGFGSYGTDGITVPSI